jgi:hypothetical protein
MAGTQAPWGVDALAGAITEPAWRTRPSWYLVTTVSEAGVSSRSLACRILHPEGPTAIYTMVQGLALPCSAVHTNRVNGRLTPCEQTG